ncbi:superfamily I DNA/RNA helicase [Bacillus tianshenii]|uniref:DNA 3'-5' helicase n=1 Tax=Sutcliffiella tianshenii TaxID=1463404 RepID=A0ABS2NZI6_9BACI|nr:ATP-dependent helicase [Bacillus tianshenii]MBM7620046.1 superfamily I DNA/RNA helicase [Bacillus tianshenii]
MSIEAIEHELTEKQQEVVDYDGEELLIKGIAGSGKTTVLLNKARKMIKKDPSIRIGLFTYNKTLSTYAKYIADQIGPDNLYVYNFHSWAFQPLRQAGKMKWVKVANTKDRKNYLQQSIKECSSKKHRFAKEDKFHDFLLEEISWIKGKAIITSSDYMEASRTGRGGDVRVTKKDREVLFSIYEGYETAKKIDGKVDYDDYGLTIYQNKAKLSDQYKFDCVMVDEAQDLQQIQLMLLRYIAKERFVVAADKGQKIYKTSFSWKEIGINILGGRTKVLQNSFRSTRQIIQMAHSLQQHDSIINDEEYVQPVLPEYTGPMPDVFECGGKKEHDAAVIETIKKLQKDNPEKTIGILSKEWRSTKRFYYSLQAEGIPHEFIEKEKGNVHTPGVKLTTFHSAKGLEFDYVIIIDLIDELTDKEIQDDEYMEVERRLLYVSITRAKTYLQLYYYGKPSVLIGEIDEQFYNKHII